MECVALGLPSVSTDLSGFGAYVERHIPVDKREGMLVLKRSKKSFDECSDELADHLLHFAQLNRRQRIELRNSVERNSEMFDWSQLIQYYDRAHDLALERSGSIRPGVIDVRVL